MSVAAVVAPSVKTPSVYLTVNLKSGAPAPGSAAKRALIVATKSSVGTIAADTQLEKGVDPDTVKTLVGIGTPGHLCAKRLFEEYRIALVDVIAPAANGGGVAATGIINFVAGVTAARTVRSYVAGRLVETVWAASETAQVIAERHRDNINKLGEESPVVATAAQDGAGPDWDCILTFRVVGPIGNDCRVYTELVGGAGGSIADVADNTLAGGTGEPDYTNAIATLANEEYDLVVNCCSNADIQSGGASSNPGRVKTDLNLRQTGADAKLQQQLVGATAALSALKTGTGALNHDVSQVAFCLAGQSLPAEFAGAEAGARLREEAINPVKNRIGLLYRARLFGARDLTADTPTAVEVEDALNTGITILKYTAAGELFPSRPITTYHKDALANPDARVLDVSVPTGTFAVARDLRVAIPLEFPQKSLSADLEPGDDPPPPDVVEVRDVLAFINARVRFWIARGVVQRARWDEVVASGEFAANVNPSDDSQLDVSLPMRTIRPLAKVGIDVRHVQ